MKRKKNRTTNVIYENKVKPVLDKVLSFGGLVVLSPLLGGISLAVYLDDPGSVFFTQKRVGKDKKFFRLHKFRSMKMSTPHDVPTHQLEDPEQYLTRVGKILRKTSLDELPQMWDIYRGKMSIVGPRPALWNQDDLVAERDKYGANDVLPGLTGWAQINGRDELEIPVKAKLDGEYVRHLKQGGIRAALFDVKCLVGTVTSVLRHDGVVEGGTGSMEHADETAEYGYHQKFEIDKTAKKRVLITGEGSYIGESFRAYAAEHYGENFAVDTVDMRDVSWKTKDFSSYDVVFHVAGIAHADTGRISEETRQKYYAVNTELAVETAKKAKADSVGQFILMSSMIVYGEAAPYGKAMVIDEHTRPRPANFYGDSKWQADKGVRQLADADFQIAVLRPPMIYGPGCKGNYPKLAKLAKLLPVFPDVDNQRSMLYIGNLCEFLCQLMLSGAGGIYFPQNAVYTNTSELVQVMAAVSGKKVKCTSLLKPAVRLAGQMPGRIGILTNKVFGNYCYSRKLSIYEGLDYQKYDLRESVYATENLR